MFYESGGHARVRLEDSLYIRRGELTESNAEQVEKKVGLTTELTDLEIVSPDDVGSFLGLKGQEYVLFWEKPL